MTKNLTIGFDAKRAFVNAAGLGNYSRNTLKALAEFYPKSRYLLFTPKVVDSRFPLPLGTTVITPDNLCWRVLKPFWRRFKISELAHKANLDIYHGLSHELPIGIEKTGIKSIVTIHDLIFIRFPELYKATDRKIYYKKYRHACQVADHIIAISEQSKSDIIEFFKIEPQKISVIYQSINSIFYDFCNVNLLEETQKKYGLPRKFILSVGTIEARKNIKPVLQAISDSNFELPLVIVGKPTKYLKTIQPLIHKLGGQLIFLHGVNDEELSRIYRLAQLMIYVSVFEGFGLPIVEAQAAGCPVITSKVSSMPEAGGDAAHYVSPNSVPEISNAINKLIDDNEYHSQLVVKGYENAKRFRAESYSNQLMEIYKKVYDER